MSSVVAFSPTNDRDIDVPFVIERADDELEGDFGDNDFVEVVDEMAGDKSPF